MFNNLYGPNELASYRKKEQFIESVNKVTEDNLFAVFENINRERIIKLILEDKIYFSLSDRNIHIDDIESELSQHNEVMLEVIRGATTIKEQLEIFTNQAIDEVIADYEVPYVS